MEPVSFLRVAVCASVLVLSGCVGDGVVRTHLAEAPRPPGCQFEVRTDMPVEAYDDVATLAAHVAAPTDPAIHDAVARAVCDRGGDVFVVTDDENGTVRGEVVRLRESPI